MRHRLVSIFSGSEMAKVRYGPNLLEELERIRDGATLSATKYVYHDKILVGELSKTIELGNSLFLNIFLATLLTFVLCHAFGAINNVVVYWLFQRELNRLWDEVGRLFSNFLTELDHFLDKHNVPHPWMKKDRERLQTSEVAEDDLEKEMAPTSKRPAVPPLPTSAATIRGRTPPRKKGPLRHFDKGSSAYSWRASGDDEETARIGKTRRNMSPVNPSDLWKK